jgi:predicted amino acid dehydrogenase
MNSFAFILHPLSVEDAFRKYPWARVLPGAWVERAMALTRPRVLSEITGLRSATGAEARGWFVVLPLTSRLLTALPAERTVPRVLETCKLAASVLKPDIIGLGAFTKVVGDAGVTVAKELSVPVTTGNSYTVATAIEAALLGAEKMGLDLAQTGAAVVGAAGSIGRVCAKALARQVARLELVDISEERLQPVLEEIRSDVRTKAAVTACSQVPEALQRSRLVVSATSAVGAVIHPGDLQPGTVVCDPARPRDVSAEVGRVRDDVLVVDGGVVEVPGEVDFHFNFGFPPRTAYACMAETMILALEGKFESFSLGRQLSEEKVEEIAALGRKHGFRLAGLRAFERAVTDEEIAAIRERAQRRRSSALTR